MGALESAWTGAIGLVNAELQAGAADDDQIRRESADQNENFDLLMDIASNHTLSFRLITW